MQGYPEENELLSLFECEPTFIETPSDSIGFFYSEATYKFSNGSEDFIVTIQPSYSEVKIRVTSRRTKKLITHLDLRRVYHFEITDDNKDSSGILMRVEDDTRLQTIEVDFKPDFKLIIKEHYNF